MAFLGAYIRQRLAAIHADHDVALAKVLALEVTIFVINKNYRFRIRRQQQETCWGGWQGTRPLSAMVCGCALKRSGHAYRVWSQWTEIAS
jgi:hypothetical protein